MNVTLYPAQGADAINVTGFTSQAETRVVVLSVQTNPSTTYNIHFPQDDAIRLAAMIKDAAGF